MLGAVLEGEAGRRAGRLELVESEVDAEPEIAAPYAFDRFLCAAHALPMRRR
jgi:hypothetical protein